VIATTLVGSYPQPDWLVDKSRYRETVVPRIRMPDLWRPAAALLEEAQDDAVRMAVHDMERAGVDVLTDGEQRRESYFNQFANALTGIDVERPGEAINRLGKRQAVPRVTGTIRRERPIFLRDAQFLRAVTERPIKIAVPGPFTLSALAQDEHYRDAETLAMAYAAAVNEELRALEPVVDWIQLDEPYLEAQVDRARAYALTAIDRALDGIRKPTCVHVCFGYAFSHALAGTAKSGGYAFALELERSSATHVSLEAAQPRLDLGALAAFRTKTVVLGVLDLGTAAVESADTVASRLAAALEHVPAERLVAAPDCGMKFLDRSIARGKLRALVDGARLAVA
jgi:5-methyltetrahydropteroyltriglutamate--homocysteine methyltransferase